jgi:hypothetical protein
MMFLHKQVDLATPDSAPHVLGGKGAETFQVDLRTEGDYRWVNSYGAVCPGRMAGSGDAVVLAAADPAGAVGGNLNRKRVA